MISLPEHSSLAYGAIVFVGDASYEHRGDGLFAPVDVLAKRFDVNEGETLHHRLMS